MLPAVNLLLIPRELEALAERSRRRRGRLDVDARRVLEDWMLEQGDDVAAWLARGEWIVWPNDDEACFEVLVARHVTLAAEYPPNAVHPHATAGYVRHVSCALMMRFDGTRHREATIQRFPRSDPWELNALRYALGDRDHMLGRGVQDALARPVMPLEDCDEPAPRANDASVDETGYTRSRTLPTMTLVQPEPLEWRTNPDGTISGPYEPLDVAHGYPFRWNAENAACLVDAAPVPYAFNLHTTIEVRGVECADMDWLRPAEHQEGEHPREEEDLADALDLGVRGDEVEDEADDGDDDRER